MSHEEDRVDELEALIANLSVALWDINTLVEALLQHVVGKQSKEEQEEFDQLFIEAKERMFRRMKNTVDQVNEAHASMETPPQGSEDT